MKIDNRLIVYMNVVLLFISTFLLASKVIKGIKTGEFDFLLIAVSAITAVFAMFFVVKYSNKVNNKEK